MTFNDIRKNMSLNNIIILIGNGKELYKIANVETDFD